MTTPAIIFIMLHALGLGINLADHGKPKTGNTNFFLHLGVSACITYPLLYWGGFFTPCVCP